MVNSVVSLNGFLAFVVSSVVEVAPQSAGLENPHAWFFSSKYKPAGHLKYLTCCAVDLANKQT